MDILSSVSTLQVFPSPLNSCRCMYISHAPVRGWGWTGVLLSCVLRVRLEAVSGRKRGRRHDAREEGLPARSTVAAVVAATEGTPAY